MVKRLTLFILLGGLSQLASRASERAGPFDLSAAFNAHTPIRLHLDVSPPAEFFVRTHDEFVCAFRSRAAWEERWCRPSFQEIRLYPFPLEQTTH